MSVALHIRQENGRPQKWDPHLISQSETEIVSLIPGANGLLLSMAIVVSFVKGIISTRRPINHAPGMPQNLPSSIRGGLL